jgi:hypothetical protein
MIFKSLPRSWLEHDSLSPKGNRPLATRTNSRVLNVSLRDPTLVSTPQSARFDKSSFVEDDPAIIATLLSIMAGKKNSSFSRCLPDVVTKELVFVLSQKTSYEFKPPAVARTRPSENVDDRSPERLTKPFHPRQTIWARSRGSGPPPFGNQRRGHGQRRICEQSRNTNKQLSLV